MIDDLLAAVLSTRKTSLRRKASGAVIEIAGLGLLGCASLFAMVGGFLWFSLRMEAWLAAFAVAGIVLALAAIGLAIGQAVIRGRVRRRDGELDHALGDLAPLVAALGGAETKGPATPKAQTSLIVAALATGLALGRALRR